MLIFTGKNEEIMLFMYVIVFERAVLKGTVGGDNGLRSTRRRTNSPTPTRRRIKSSRDVGELVVNPIQLIRS